MIRVATFGGFRFEFGIRVLSISRELEILSHKYPNISGAEAENLGGAPLIFTIEAIFPGSKSGLNDFRRLVDLFELGKPQLLFLPGEGFFNCFFKRFSETLQSGGSKAKEVEIEFVETLQANLSLDRKRDELEDLRALDPVLQTAFLIADEAAKQDPPLVERSLLDKTLEFIGELRKAATIWQQKIQDIQDKIARPYNEMMRFAAEFEQIANKANDLSRSLLQYANLPYTLARRLKTMGNVLTSIARRFLPPPVDAKGRIIGEQFHGVTLSHRVVSGDTLETISLQYYGSAMIWECLAEANGIFDGNALRVGDTLVIPSFGDRTPQRIQTKPGKSRIGQSKCAV